ncbi:MAG: class I SAM-dependent methyltransferase [Acidobacteria bacterium]|nr:class I SAM-dependent methyltransferase [Acidobacteriota bacterium]
MRSLVKGLSVKEHNSRENMDAIYADPNLMTHYFTPERLAFYRQVRGRLLRLAVEPSDVLDVGCGSGHLLAEVKKLFPSARLMGVDFSPESIKVARRLNPALVFEVLSIFDVEKLGRQYDLILCTELIEHLEEADIALEKLVAICRPGGAIVITVPHGRKDAFLGHFNFWTPESFRREFRKWQPYIGEFENYLFIVIRRR